MTESPPAMLPRVILVLSMIDRSLVKTRKFAREQYVGDPLNAVRIFNEKEVDEIALLDIRASQQTRSPNFDLIRDIVSEAFVPVSYGGGISNVGHARELIRLGCEKVVLGTAAVERPKLIAEISGELGAQSVSVSVDYKRDLFRRTRVYAGSGRDKTSYAPLEFAQICQNEGAGELILHAIEREGMISGYDLEVISEVSAGVDIPVVSLGGAGSLQDLSLAVGAGASAVAASRMFVLHGKHAAVLLQYPNPTELRMIFNG